MFTHADKGELQTVTFTAESIKNWSWRIWALMALVVVSISGALYECITTYIEYGLVWGYLAAIGAIVFIYVVVTAVYSKTHYLHVHHYNIGYFIVFLVVAQTPLVSIANAIGMGMAVEGSCRWGMDPIWEKKTVPYPLRSAKKT